MRAWSVGSVNVAYGFEDQSVSNGEHGYDHGLSEIVTYGCEGQSMGNLWFLGLVSVQPVVVGITQCRP